EERDARDLRRDRQRGLLQRLGGHEDLRLAVLDDVLDLAGRQLRGQAGEAQARALGGPQELVVARVVLDEEGDRVAGREAQAAEQVRALVGAGVQLAI